MLFDGDMIDFEDEPLECLSLPTNCWLPLHMLLVFNITISLPILPGYLIVDHAHTYFFLLNQFRNSLSLPSLPL